MSSASATLSGFESARLMIAHLKLGDARELAPAIKRAVTISATSLGVPRVGVWMLSEDRRRLGPLHVIGSPAMQGGYTELQLRNWPAYAAAIDACRVIAAHDARTDPRTAELTESYLDPLGIGSMLDVPIFVGGQVWGIVCHEHVGPPRTWTEREIDFAISVADMLSALFEQASRLTVERELRARDAMAANQRKNAALVRMSAGVAHDFNTVLQTILLLAESAARIRDRDPSEALAQIKVECTRGGRIVRQLLDFARSTPRTMAPLDLATVVDDMHGALATLVGATIQLEVRTPRAVPVSGDPAQLEQVIMNLVVNARDAMPAGGTLRVVVGVEEELAFLAVSDEGLGIPDDVRERIFEPFFTTKGEEGTGLGLATVAVISEQHGGTISVDSGDSGGTTFMVRFPLRHLHAGV